MEKVIRFIDLQSTIMEDLFWSLDCYRKDEIDDGVKYQFEFLRRYDELEEMYLEFTDEELDLLDWIPNIMGINSERRTYLFYPSQE